MPTLTKKRIWGIEYSEDYCDGFIVWRTWVKKPFYQDGRWKVGLNEKFLYKAREQGVHGFRIVVGQKEIPMAVPSKKYLREKEKRGEYELKDSLFENSPALKIYYFFI